MDELQNPDAEESRLLSNNVTADPQVADTAEVIIIVDPQPTDADAQVETVQDLEESPNVVVVAEESPQMDKLDGRLDNSVIEAKGDVQCDEIMLTDQDLPKTPKEEVVIPTSDQ